jgi:hypothetical protein
MRVIALEEHVLPRDIIGAAGIDIGLRAGNRAADLHEMGEGRINRMSESGAHCVGVDVPSGFFTKP